MERGRVERKGGGVGRGVRKDVSLSHDSFLY